MQGVRAINSDKRTHTVAHEVQILEPRVAMNRRNKVKRGRHAREVRVSRQFQFVVS